MTPWPALGSYIHEVQSSLSPLASQAYLALMEMAYPIGAVPYNLKDLSLKYPLPWEEAIQELKGNYITLYETSSYPLIVPLHLQERVAKRLLLHSIPAQYTASSWRTIDPKIDIYFFLPALTPTSDNNYTTKPSRRTGGEPLRLSLNAWADAVMKTADSEELKNRRAFALLLEPHSSAIHCYPQYVILQQCKVPYADAAFPYYILKAVHDLHLEHLPFVKRAIAKAPAKSVSPLLLHLKAVYERKRDLHFLHPPYTTNLPAKTPPFP